MFASNTSDDDLTRPLGFFIPCLLLVAAVLLAYGNVYDNAFLYDDEYLILKNEFLRGWGHIGDIFTHYVTDGAHRQGLFFRPLQNILYLVVYQIGGADTFGFHVLNIGLHAANACLVYVLGRKLGFNPMAVFLAAFVWAMHPLFVEAVTYMSGTADTLAALFCLWGLIILLPDFSVKRMRIAAVLMLLGILSKETAIVFPALAMACMYLTNGQRLKPRLYVRTWPLWAIALVYFIVRVILMHYGHRTLLNVDLTSKAYEANIGLRVTTFLATLPSYFGLILWPAGLHMDRNFPVYFSPFYPEVFAGTFFILAALAQIVWGRGKRGLPLSFGLIWFAAAHAPQTGVFLPVNSILLEHWMYLPIIGLCLGVAQTLAEGITDPVARGMVGAAAFLSGCGLGMASHQQNFVWHDTFSFYQHILDEGETSVRAHNNLGIAYMDSGDFQSALNQFNAALKDNDLTPETHENIASAFSRMPGGGPRLIPEQIKHLDRALELKPEFLPANESLLSIYIYLGDREKAAFYRERVNDIRRKYVP